MKEARIKLNEVKRDRGYGKVGSGSSSLKKGTTPSSKKNPCFDYGLPGHWAGDAECRQPGAGLARTKKPGHAKPVKHVKIAEALQAEVEADSMIPEAVVHEIQMASHEPNRHSLRDALESHSNELNAASPHVLSWDKRFVGALDTACNRTVTGTTWLSTYLQALQDSPAHVQSMIKCFAEREVFHFGNGGTQSSQERWRLPIVLGGQLICINVSVVPVPSLGLLLGRDFLESLGSTLSFAKKTIVFSILGPQVVHLQQLMAGHFMLHLQPKDGLWPGLGPEKWRKLGVDGVWLKFS